MKRLIIVLVALLLVGGAVYSLQFGQKGSRLERGVSRGIELSPDYVNRYALRPDRRFELALGDLNSLISGESASFETKRDGASWSVEGPRGIVVRFDHPPAYMELFSALKKQASSLGLKPDQAAAAHPAARLEILERSPFFPFNGSVLEDVNRSFSLSSSTEVIVASSAATMLYVQTYDTARFGDSLGARALALAAIRAVVSPRATVSTDCLLSFQMGYIAEAEGCARALPAQDAVRSYILRDRAALQRSAETPLSSPWSRYLYARLLYDERAVLSAREALQELLPERTATLAGLALKLRTANFADMRAASAAYPILSLTALLTANGKAEQQTGQLFSKLSDFSATTLGIWTEAAERTIGIGSGSLGERFEQEADEFSGRFKGAPFSPQVIRDALRTAYYSSVVDRSLFMLKRLSSTAGSEELLRTIRVTSDPRSAQIVRWFTSLIDVDAGKAGADVLLTDLRELPALGPELLETSLRDLEQRAYPPGAFTWEGADIISRSLDSRPVDRMRLVRIARKPLYNPAVEQIALRGAAAVGGKVGAQATVSLARIQKDTTLLDQLISANAHNAEVALVGLLGKRDLGKGAESEEASREIRQLLQEHSSSNTLLERAIDGAARGGRSEETIQLGKLWLERFSDRDPLTVSSVRNAIGRAYLKLKKPAEAFAIVQPALEVGQLATMMVMSEALTELKKFDLATEVIRSGAKRYPNSIPARVAAARVYWARGEHATAAKVLKSGTPAPTEADWSDHIVPAFLSALSSADDRDTLQAVRELARVGFMPIELTSVLAALERAGRSRVALDGYDLVQVQGPGVAYQISGKYRAIKAVSGETAAQKYLDQSKFTPRNMVVDVLFFERSYELLWKFTANPEAGPHGDYTWLLRAYALQLAPDALSRYSQSVKDYFSKNSKTRYQRMGRWVLGLGEFDLEDELGNPRTAFEAAFAAAMNALRQRREREALSYLQALMDVGGPKNVEWRWAAKLLREWSNIDALEEGAGIEKI